MDLVERYDGVLLSPEEASGLVTALRAELLRQYRAHPIVNLAARAAASLNDILNAAALRLALLRWQRDGSRADADLDRLIGLVDQAGLLVHVLQRYVRAAQLGLPRQSSDGEAAASGPEDLDLKRELEETTRTPSRALIILEPGTDGSPLGVSLERSGYSVTIAASAEDGLARLRSGDRFDNVVCDTSVLRAGAAKFVAAVASAAPIAKLYLLTRSEIEAERPRELR